MTTDEIFKNTPQALMDKPESEEDYLNIDWNTRKITPPAKITNIGVFNDKDSNRLYFRCPVDYGECKVSEYGLRVNYVNKGDSGTEYDGDVYFVDDAKVENGYITFSWLVGRHAYLEKGTTAFVVCCKVVDSDDNVVNELNTTVATLSVLEGLEVDVLPPEDYPDYLEELLRRVEAAEETADSALTTAQEAKDAIPTKVSQLTNDIPYATEDDVQAVADSAITGVTVNGTEQPVNDNVAELTIEVDAGVAYFICPDRASDEPKWIDFDTDPRTDGAVFAIRFTNGNTIEETHIQSDYFNPISTIGDARCPENSVVFFVYSTADRAFVVDAGLTRANEANDAIPTKVSELDNDVPYATQSALSDVKVTADQAYADATAASTVANDALTKANETAENAITAITVNGEDVPVEDNKAGIEFDDVSNGSDGIKALTVDGDLFDYVNEICDTIGVYFMRATSDTPNIPETAAFFIMLLRNSNTQATMIAFRAGSNTNTYMCKEQASAWGDWTQIIPSGGSEPTYDADSETLIF